MKNEQKELRDHQIVTRAMRRLHAEDEITINRFVIAKDAFAGTLERLFEELGQTEAQKAVKNSMERARQGKPPSTELDNAVLTYRDTRLAALQLKQELEAVITLSKENIPMKSGEVLRAHEPSPHIRFSLARLTDELK